MKRIIFVLFFISIVTSYPQSKYFIYFKDKGIKPGAVLSKSSEAYSKALSFLTKRSIERRRKVLGDNNIISYDDLPIKDDYIQSFDKLGIKIENKLTWFNAVTAYLTKSQKEEIGKLSFVKKIEPVRIIKIKKDFIFEPHQFNKPSTVPFNGVYGNSYTEMNMSGIPKVQSKGITGKGVIIGILDSGFRWKTHEALENANVLSEYDFVFKDSITYNQPGDDPNQDSHGTFVFSLIGGHKDSVLVGAAYNASFILAKTEDIRSESHVEEDNYAAALIWMEAQGVDITTSSLGYNEFDDSTYSYTYSDMDGKTTIVTRAAELAFSKGVVTITSAGNEGNNKWHYIIAPADGFNTMAVGAVSSDSTVASFSSRGPTFDGRIKPDIMAMGVNNFGAGVAKINDYRTGSGTSFSAPISCGAAALLLSAYPYLTNVQVRDILMKTSSNADNPDNEKGYGIVSAASAISFPNLEISNNVYKIHKMFFLDQTIKPSTAQIHYSANGKDYLSEILTSVDSLKYYFTLPSYLSGQEIQFYFTYQDVSGKSYREPAVNSIYKYSADNIWVHINEDKQEVPTGYALAQNYPNPFNNSTTITFYTPSEVKADMVIFNAIGQQIKVLFNGITAAGKNILTWNGVTDKGNAAASGFYYYVLKLNGKQYSKKMILLK